MSVYGQPPDAHRVTVQWCDLLEHAVTAVPLYVRGWDPLSYTGHQVSLPREVVVGQVFNLRGNYTQGVQPSLITTDTDTNKACPGFFLCKNFQIVYASRPELRSKN